MPAIKERKADPLNEWRKHYRFDQEIRRVVPKNFDTRYLQMLDAEFVANRRDFVAGGERIQQEDRTLIQGIPVEWLKEDEYKELIADSYYEDQPLEYANV